MVPEAQIRGYKPGRFSFNVKVPLRRMSRCRTQNHRDELCQMFIFNAQHAMMVQPRDMEVRYKGKSISGVLDMNIDEAVVFFENIPSILKKIQTIKDVGLGYIN